MVEFVRLAQNTLFRLRPNAIPRPMKKNASTTTGKGGVQTSMMYATIMRLSASTSMFALPSLACKACVIGAALIKPMALVMKIRDTIA